jgi:dCMP deaminase
MKWYRRYLAMAKLIASWSKDPKHQVGCVLVDECNRIISTGYNGYPRGLDNLNKQNRLAMTIHAEENAMLQANQSPITAYIWPTLPCSNCMAKLAQIGIQRVVSKQEASAKWRPELTYEICNHFNIEIILL